MGIFALFLTSLEEDSYKFKQKLLFCEFHNKQVFTY